MAFYKICDCGKKIVFEESLKYPEICTSCGRNTTGYITYSENEVINLNNSSTHYENKTNTNNKVNNIYNSNNNSAYKLVLKSKNEHEVEIEIPSEGAVLGRSSLGSNYLLNFPSVSREHCRIIPKEGIGAIVEDLSSYGTFINGNKLTKYTPVCAKVNSEIMLYNVRFTLLEKGR